MTRVRPATHAKPTDVRDTLELLEERAIASVQEVADALDMPRICAFRALTHARTQGYADPIGCKREGKRGVKSWVWALTTAGVEHLAREQAIERAHYEYRRRVA